MMLEPVFLSVDMGTTNTKACLVSLDGKTTAVSRSEYASRLQRPSPYETFEVALRTMEQVLHRDKVNRKDVVGLVFSARNDGGMTVALDKCDHPVELNVRMQEVQELHVQLSAELFPEHIKDLLGVLGIVPFLRWLQTRDRIQYDRISKLMGVKDYTIYRLSGAFACDILDRGYLRIPVNFCERKGIIEDAEIKLPKVVPPTEVVGWLKPEFARRLDLREDLPICVGSRDGNCANVGCGTVELGQACVTLATYGVIRVVWDNPLLDIPKNRISPRLHAVPGQWLLDSTPGGGAMVLRWFKDNFAQLEAATETMTARDVYAILDREGELSNPASKGLLFLPYLTGMSAPELNREATGVLFGLKLDHTRGDIIRAFMAGVAYAIRSGMEIIEGIGAKVSELRVTGGGARASVWNRMLADITHKTVLTSSVEEVECLGASALLATGLGEYRSVKEAVAHMVKVKDTYLPQDELRSVYDKQYRLYLDVCEALNPIFSKATDARKID